LSILDFLGIVPSNVNILAGFTEFQALSQYVLMQNNFIQPKTLGRVLNVGNQNARSTFIAAGWLNTIPSNYQTDKGLCNKMFFEMHMIDRGAAYLPAGKVTLRYPAANLTFKSDNCDWLLLQN